ncbi:MAG: hypothetical protein QOJ50_1512, partial [Cryptosporangiaceae bacterium]|nr:hypothetical protein [Cryptosporangiaceae bacterium]
LFDAGDIRRPRPWCADPAGWIVARALDAIECRLNTATGGETIRVLDYGAGTGFGAIEVLKAISERGITDRLAASDVSLELHLVDLPTEWFAQSARLLGAHPWVHFHDLRSGGGGFRALPEVMSGRPVDVIIANMVFHLIPAKAMTRVAGSMAAVLRPGGSLLWNSPDVGPAGRAAVLFHDANRAVRKEWLRESAGESLPRDVYSAVRHAHTALTAEAQERANRRILPQPNDVDDIAAALGTHLAGSTCRADFEILSDELLDTLLVPSNAAEYFPELVDHSAREAVIRALMAKVMGTLGHGPAATAGGLNVSWTFGQSERRPTAR